MLLAALLAMLCALSAPARAADALTPCFVPMQAGDTALGIAHAHDRWVCPDRQQAIGAGSYWAVLRLPQRTSDAPRVLRWSSTWQDAVDVSFIGADNSVQSVMVRSADGARDMKPGAIYQLSIDERDTEARFAVGQFHNAANLRGVWLHPVLMDQDSATRINLFAAALYGSFIGMCVALVAYNIVIWAALRQTYQLLYCGMVLATGLYAASTSGFLGFVFEGLANNDRLRINYVGLALVGAFAVGFGRTFLDPIVFSRRMDRWMAFVVGCVLCAAAAFALWSPAHIQLIDRLYFLSFGALLATAIYMLVRAARAGGTIGRLFVVAWCVPIAVNMARLLHGLNMLDYSYQLDNSTLLAMTFEALLSSMIIAYRIRMVQKDRDRAMAEGNEARRLADTDPLTGLLNRRALLRYACPHDGGSRPWRLILIDIDHFKQVNDIAGHATGDEVLVTVASIITASLRPEAIAARIGGEEFAILFPSDGRDRRLYANILPRVRNAVLPGGMRVTVSMGVADGPLGPDETLWRHLYRRADAALYAAKQQGRDRLVQAGAAQAMPQAA